MLCGLRSPRVYRPRTTRKRNRVADDKPASAITATTAPVDLARAALAAQGGDKFKAVKSMILRGSVDLYAPNSTQSIPGGFVIVTAGDKLRSEVDARPAISFKQIYDGQQSYSSLPGVDLPPLTKFGMALLMKYDQAGHTVSAIPDKKKLRGFRIADSEGRYDRFLHRCGHRPLDVFSHSLRGLHLRDGEQEVQRSRRRPGAG